MSDLQHKAKGRQADGDDPSHGALHRGISLLIATPDHAELITSLHAQVFDEPWDARAIKTLLEADTAVSFFSTANAGHVPTGFVIGRIAGADAEIITIGVVPSHQKMGIGTALLAGFCRASETVGATRAVFEVEETNVAARALYAGDGFETVGQRANYYGPDRDALILARRLASDEAVESSGHACE